MGSVRSLAVTTGGSHFVSAGLDRYMRIFEVGNPKPVHRVYMKSKLNCLLVSPDFDPSGAIQELARAKAEREKKEESKKPSVGNGEKEGAGADTDDKFWSKLKIIREKPKKRKNPAQGSEPSKRINR